MIINAQNLKALQRTLDTAFAKAMKEAIDPKKSITKRLCYDKKALNRKRVEYPWISARARIEKLLKGQSQEKQRLPVNRLTVEAGKATLLISIDEFDLVCDEEGIYIDAVRSDGSEMADFDERSAAALLKGGFATKSGDGQAKNFFDTGRKVSPDLGAASAVYDNLLTDALGAVGYDKARKALFKMTDGKGNQRGLGSRGMTLTVGADLEGAALELIGVPTLPNGGANKYYNSAEVVVSPYLGDGNNWFLSADSAESAGKPLIRQTNQEWASRMTGTEDVSAIVDGEILYQQHWRGEHAYGDPQRIIGSTGAGA